MFKCLAVAAVATFLCVTTASAHGGGLDPAGCHHNRKTGGYHCHRKPVNTEWHRTQSSSDNAQNTVHYRNCAAARAAGAAPVRRGDPGYGIHLDRDRDGIGCE